MARAAREGPAGCEMVCILGLPPAAIVQSKFRSSEKYLLLNASLAFSVLWTALYCIIDRRYQMLIVLKVFCEENVVGGDGVRVNLLARRTADSCTLFLHGNFISNECYKVLFYRSRDLR